MKTNKELKEMEVDDLIMYLEEVKTHQGKVIGLLKYKLGVYKVSTY